MSEIQACSKCMTPIGSDAVFLKNGTYLCPACYQRAYPAKKAPDKPKRFDVSVEGVIAIVVVVGVMFLGYKIYGHVTQTRREEALNAQKALEDTERRRKEEQDLADAKSKQAAQDRKEADERTQRERITKAEAAKAAAELRQKTIDAAKAEAEQRRLAEERRLEEIREKQRHEADTLKGKETVSAARTRTAELNTLARTIAEANKALNAAEHAKPELLRKSFGYKSLAKSAEDTKAALLRQYNSEFPSLNGEPSKTIPHWRNPPAEKTTTVKNATGQGTATIDRSADYAKLVTKFDAAARQLETNEALLKTAGEEMAKAEAAAMEAKAKIDDCNRRLTELNATPAEISAAAIGTPAQPGTGSPAGGAKTITKKDGSQIKARSIMSLEDEVRYKDDDGKWQTVKKADVEKIE